jgi:hypothetical protein
MSKKRRHSWQCFRVSSSGRDYHCRNCPVSVSVSGGKSPTSKKPCGPKKCPRCNGTGKIHK